MGRLVRSADKGAPRRLRVLVVEDETLLCLSLEAMLEDWGFEQVGSVGTGRGAVRLARETRPDVVLMDINLEGGMDGIAAAAAIRGFSETPIVFMTAYSDADLAARQGLGGCEVLRKPFSPRRLHEILDEIAARLEPAAAALMRHGRDRDGDGDGHSH